MKDTTKYHITEHCVLSEAMSRGIIHCSPLNDFKCAKKHTPHHMHRAGKIKWERHATPS